jgi:TusA-related sulfurtransferase
VYSEYGYKLGVWPGGRYTIFSIDIRLQCSKLLLREFLVLEYDQMLDVSGLACPMPLLKMKQRLNAMLIGSVLYVITTDKASVRDFAVFLKQAGHLLVRQHEADEKYHFWIKKGP